MKYKKVLLAVKTNLFNNGNVLHALIMNSVKQS